MRHMHMLVRNEMLPVNQFVTRRYGVSGIVSVTVNAYRRVFGYNLSRSPQVRPHG